MRKREVTAIVLLAKDFIRLVCITSRTSSRSDDAKYV